MSLPFHIPMVRVPAGPFLMGADPSIDTESDAKEEPQREVWLSAFDIQRTPVTVEQWQQFLIQTGYQWNFGSEINQGAPTVSMLADRALLMMGYHGSLMTLVERMSPGPNCPIIWVTWYDCVRFTEWLTESTGNKWALPTEAEWEKACRGTAGQLFPWGNERPGYLDEAIPDTYCPVGARLDRQSPYGCLDMWDSVAQWCKDWFDDEWYKRMPEDVRDPVGPTSGESKVVRGGGPAFPGWPRCSYRRSEIPSLRCDYIGFRVVRRG